MEKKFASFALELRSLKVLFDKYFQHSIFPAWWLKWKILKTRENFTPLTLLSGAWLEESWVRQLLSAASILDTIVTGDTWSYQQCTVWQSCSIPCSVWPPLSTPAQVIPDHHTRDHLSPLHQLASTHQVETPEQSRERDIDISRRWCWWWWDVVYRYCWSGSTETFNNDGEQWFIW